jgi:hypothetical protein
MVASLNGFIARKDGRVDWLETLDEFVLGEARNRRRQIRWTLDIYVKVKEFWVACKASGHQTIDRVARLNPMPGG